MDSLQTQKTTGSFQKSVHGDGFMLCSQSPKSLNFLQFDDIFKEIKETSENQFLVYHFILFVFIFMQTNAIHLCFLLPLKTWKAKSLHLKTVGSSSAVPLTSYLFLIPCRQWQSSLLSGANLCNLVLNLTEVVFLLCNSSLSKVQWFFFLIALTPMTKYLVSNVFFMLNYPVVCLLKIKLSLAGNCMMEQRKELGLCSQTDMGLNFALMPAVWPWAGYFPSQWLSFLSSQAECLVWL